MGSGNNTTGVIHESALVSGDGDGDWSLLDGGFQGRGRSSGNFVDSSDLDLSGVGRVVASSVSGSVGVLALEVLGVGLNVLHGVFLPSTVATVALGVAVNDLLLREGEESSSGDLVMSLNGGGGRESPAGSARLLVLDWVDGTLGSPVNRGGGWEGELKVGWEGLWSLVSEHLSEFLFSHVRELVMSVGGGSVHGVKLSNGFVGLKELLESEFVFLFGSVGLSVLNNVAHERSLGGGDFGVGSSRGNKKGEGSHVNFFLYLIIL